MRTSEGLSLAKAEHFLGQRRHFVIRFQENRVFAGSSRARWRMLSLTCASVHLTASGSSGRRSVRPVWRSSRRRSGGARCMVSTARDVDVQRVAVSSCLKPEESYSGPFQVSSLLQVVSGDLKRLNENLKSIVGAENPVLVAAAEQILGAGGKRLRPALVFLVSRATAQIYGMKELTVQHQRLAEIIEMIHTASLIHDDILDDSGMRRGRETVHQTFGTRVAVLAGDFMFAQSSWYLANLGNIEVIKDFASGEIKQASSLFNCDLTLEEYLLKSYYKTASLIAASSKSAAIFSGADSNVCEQMFKYGMNLGLSFQVVDDILDFTQSTEQLGKPAGSDISKGNLTAPVIFALEKEPKLREIINSEFSEDGSLETAIELIHRSGGLSRAQELAKQKAEMAVENLCCLTDSEFRNSLEEIVKYNLERID